MNDRMIKTSTEHMSPRRKWRQRAVAGGLLLLASACVTVYGVNWTTSISFPRGTRDTKTFDYLYSKWNVSSKCQGKWGNPAAIAYTDMYYRIDSDWVSVESTTAHLAQRDIKDLWQYTDLGINKNGERETILRSYCRVNFNLQKVAPVGGSYIWQGNPFFVFPCTIHTLSKSTGNGQSLHKITVTVVRGTRNLTLRLTATEPDGTIVYQ